MDLVRRLFHRTSSKRRWRASFVTFETLLIEPVWNRNLNSDRGYSMSSGRLLLIEPVWNRNIQVGGGLATRLRCNAFNRTSMESKHCTALLVKISLLLIEPVWNRNFVIRCVEIIPFNRTSMESKHDFQDRKHVLRRRWYFF